MSSTYIHDIEDMENVRTLLVIQEHVRQATGKANWLYSSHRRKEIIEHLYALIKIVNASLREAKEQENTDD